MRLVAQPQVNTARLEAQLASDARWLAAMLRYLGGVFAYVASLPWLRDCPLLRDAMNAAKARSHTQLRACLRDLRFIIAEKAYARLRLTHRRTSTKLYPGERRRRLHFARRATGGLLCDMHRGSLRQRVKRLQAHIANIEPLIARAVKRLYAMWRFPRLARRARIVTHGPGVCRVALGGIAFADTS